MFSSLRVLLLCSFVAAVVTKGAAAVATTKHFCYSTPTLLGGGLTSYRTPSDASACKGGYASSEAWVRRFRVQGEPTVHLMPLDFLSSFTQMHALKWDVNALFYSHYNASSWLALPSILYGANNPKMSLLRRDGFPWILTNIDIPLNSGFLDYRKVAWVDAATAIGYIVIAPTTDGMSLDDVLQCAYRGLEEVSRSTTAVKHMVVVDMNTNTAANASGIVAALQQQAYVRIDAYVSIDSTVNSDSSTFVVNGTLVAIVRGEAYSRSGLPSSNLVCIDFQLDATGNVVVKSSLGAYPTSPLPSTLLDANYYADVAFSQSLAEQAIVNDPIVGYTTTVPLISDLGAGINNCLAGDCGIGNLFTDAFRWRMGTDIALCNSGGVTGPGWAGNGARRYSDILAADPWPDTMNVATVTGLSIWEAMNASLSVPMTNVSQGGTSSIHLQMSGIRVSYGFHLSPMKMLSADVYNQAIGLWEPLQRTKLYTLVMPEYETCCVEPFATIMTKARYRGEVAAVNHADLPIQRVVQDFLLATTTASNPYVVQQYVRYTRVDSGVTSANVINWHQVQADCAPNTFWDAGVATCMACPIGLVQPATGQTTCQAPASSVNVAAIVAPVVVVCVVALLIVAVVIARSVRAARSTANAPTSGRVTIMFTDIQDSTRLWGALPMSMNTALEQHHELIRAAIAKHKGYEVKTIGDSFMIASATEDTAVQIAVDIQRSLQAAAWPPCIARAYACKTDNELEAVDDDPRAPPKHDSTFNGLRVRIGIHSGEPRVELDPVTKGYDYYGPMVNVAARVETATRGGQICISSEALSHVENKSGLSIRVLGRFDLKGVTEGADLCEIMPEELAVTRRFAYGESVMVNNGNSDPTGSMSDASDTASVAGALDDFVKPQHVALFFTRVLLQAMQPGEAKKVRAAMMKTWHVADDGSNIERGEDDFALERLCRRVLPSALRQARRAYPDEDGGRSRFSASASKRRSGATPPQPDLLLLGAVNALPQQPTHS